MAEYTLTHKREAREIDQADQIHLLYPLHLCPFPLLKKLFLKEAMVLKSIVIQFA